MYYLCITINKDIHLKINFMLDFLYYFLINPFINGDIIDMILGVFGWIIVIVILISILYAINIIFCSKSENCSGRVAIKEFTKEHTSYEFSPTLKTTVPHHYDDDYSLTIEVDNMRDTISVTEEICNKYKEDSQVYVSCSTGLLWNSLIIHEII